MSALGIERLRAGLVVLVAASMFLTLPMALDRITVATSESGVNVSENGPPVVTPLTPLTGWAGSIVWFSATATDPDGDALRYTWDFGDGSPKSVSQTVSHVYAYAGFYNFTVHVDDLTGLDGHNVSSTAQANIAFNLYLAAGWSLISVPYAGYRASTIGLPYGDMMVGWDSGRQKYNTTYIAGVSPPTYDFPLIPGAGYWVWSPAAKMLHIFGTLPPMPYVFEFTVPATGGWVLFGPVAIKHLHRASDIPGMYHSSNGPGYVRLVAAYDTAAEIYKIWMPGVPSLNNFLLIPGQGYEVFVTASGSLTWNCT